MEEILIIVDVQHCFNVKEYFVNNIFELCEKYNNVCQIWDSTSDDGPSFTFPNQTHLIEKQFGGELCLEDIDAYNWDEQKTLDILKRKFEHNELEPGDIFSAQGLHWLYVGYNHPWFIFEDELLNFFKEMNKRQLMGHLVGGAKGECLWDIEVCAEAMDASFKVLENYVY